MRRALEGFALPYGDITVGGWRNTPYVVIQNVGAYLDIPRFLDSDHRIENADDAEAYLARLQSLREAARRRAWPHAGGARRRARAARVPDRQGDGADDALGARTRATAGRSSSPSSGGRRTFPEHWGERARTIAVQEIAPALERAVARAPVAARRRHRAMRASRHVRTATSSTGGRSRPRPPRTCRRTRSTRWAGASCSACTRRWTRS